MNKSVYKYRLQETIEIPKGAEILCVKEQHDIHGTAFDFIWVLCDPENELETRTFQILMTGDKLIDNNLLIKPTYITTLFKMNRLFVVHIFENVKYK